MEGIIGILFWVVFIGVIAAAESSAWGLVFLGLGIIALLMYLAYVPERRRERKEKEGK